MVRVPRADSTSTCGLRRTLWPLRCARFSPIVRPFFGRIARVFRARYRDHDGEEIDLILGNWDRRVVAIEVKSGATVRSESFTPMRRLADVLKDKFALGVVLYDCRHGLQYGDNLWSAPISSLWA